MNALPVYSAITIADEILKIAKAHGQTVSPMKLMKLVYIAHGWALAVLRRDLFNNRIEAWPYGPVIPDLYHATKRYGAREIPLGDVGAPSEVLVDRETRAFLESVYRLYGNYSAIGLSDMTHQAGTPWQKQYVPGKRGIEIPDQLISEHYEGLLRDRQPAGDS